MTKSLYDWSFSNPDDGKFEQMICSRDEWFSISKNWQMINKIAHKERYKLGTSELKEWPKLYAQEVQIWKNDQNCTPKKSR